MAKSSRWSQWVITESADPRIQMPWAIGARVRNRARNARPDVPGVIASGAFARQNLSLH